jgi:hypothetical protein
VTDAVDHAKSPDVKFTHLFILLLSARYSPIESPNCQRNRRTQGDRFRGSGATGRRSQVKIVAAPRSDAAGYDLPPSEPVWQATTPHTIKASVGKETKVNTVEMSKHPE